MVRVIHIKLKYLIYFITGLLLGFILGLICLTLIASYQIDHFHQQIKQLQADVHDKDTRLLKLEDKLDEAKKQQKYILKDIQIKLICEEDVIDQITFIEHIKEKYMSLIGKEVDTIDLELIDQIIDKRIFKIDDKNYQLLVKKIFLSDTLILWISAKPQSNK